MNIPKAVRKPAKKPLRKAPAPAPRFMRLPTRKLYESPLNPRRAFDEDYIAELTASIREHGILEPLIVRPVDGRFEIVAGASRYRAATNLHLPTVPCQVRKLDATDALKLALLDNLQRRDISPLDEAHALERLKEIDGSVENLAKSLGKSPGYVYARLKLLELTPAAQRALDHGTLSAGHAVIVARLEPDDQAEAVAAIREGDMSVRSLELWAGSRGLTRKAAAAEPAAEVRDKRLPVSSPHHEAQKSEARAEPSNGSLPATAPQEPGTPDVHPSDEDVASAQEAFARDPDGPHPSFEHHPLSSPAKDYLVSFTLRIDQMRLALHNADNAAARIEALMSESDWPWANAIEVNILDLKEE